ncbi:MAG: hypothetical protein NTU98_10760 [Bacteroidetes bacterium]|nr:hypothetical protein [Bacteroidota bacterium]
MKRILFIIFLLFVNVLSIAAQTDTAKTHKAPNQHLYRSGTIMVITQNSGKLYYDDKYIFSIKKFNLIKIWGIKPGVHSIAMKTDSDSIRKEITVKKRWKYTGKINADSMIVKERSSTDPLLTKKVHTKLYSYVPKIRGFYNVTQVGLISVGMIATNYTSFSSTDKKDLINADGYYPLNSISTICGYRFSPRFSMGLGAGFCQMKSGRISFVYYGGNGYDNFGPSTYNYGGTVGFFPVFLDFRSDWALKKVSPFYYLDLGLILVYHQDIAQIEYYASYTQQYVTVPIEIPSKIGPYLSTGFGTKIYIHNGLAILPAIEFSYKRLIYYNNGSIYSDYPPSLTFLTLGLVLGVSF